MKSKHNNLKVKVTSKFKGDVWHFKLIKVNKYKNSEIGKLEIDFAREKKYFVISSHVDPLYRIMIPSKKFFFYGTLTLYNKLK